MIPKIIHQIWIGKEPHELSDIEKKWQASWLRLNPGWQYCFWNTQKSLDLISEYYPWFLPIYNAYDQDIKRADVMRYFILHHTGGVYADFDCECFKPLDDLFKDKDIILSLEPKEHEPYYKQGAVVSNAFIASAPQYSFWEHVFKNLKKPDIALPFFFGLNVLKETGPLFLSQAARSFPQKIDYYRLTLPDQHHSLLLSNHEFNKLRKESYVTHYWSGSWVQTNILHKISVILTPYYFKYTPIYQHINVYLDGIVNILNFINSRKDADELPFVSCVMQGEDEKSIESFKCQTYPADKLELIIIGENTLNISDKRIRYVQAFDEKDAKDYIALFESRDVSDSLRIEMQVTAMLHYNASVCFLDQIIVKGKFMFSKSQKGLYAKMYRKGWSDSDFITMHSPYLHYSRDVNLNTEGMVFPFFISNRVPL